MTLSKDRQQTSVVQIPENRRRLLRRVFLVFMVIWMLVIYAFSARDSVLSSQDSYRAATIVSKTFVRGFNSWTEEKQDSFVRKIQFPVRKTAHATEYAVLASIFVGVYWNTRWMRDDNPDHESDKGSKKADRKVTPGALFWRKLSSGESCVLLFGKMWAVCVLSSFLYACTDEFHQIFTGGRSGEFKDIWIDTGGAAAGATITLLVLFVVNKLIAVYRIKKA